MWLDVIPVVMDMGIVALIVAEYTPVFVYLGMPLIPLLSLLHIPEEDLLLIFVERTLISLPIFALVGHILFQL